jgi:NAD(P)-dependent dehydrogenase (short-subunit alcohol dehydrogenase family)
MRFSGMVALVAGGTGALGRAVSLALLQEGAQVVVTYRRPEAVLVNAVGGYAGGTKLWELEPDVLLGSLATELKGTGVRHGAAVPV